MSGTNVTAAQRAELLKNVPMNIGDWHGENMPIDEAVKKTAGAVGAVSRKYRNIRTNEVIDLWLIVGHGRAISYHTPDICYRASGFSARAVDNSQYSMVLDDDSQIPFLTNTFFRDDITGRQLVRVFWSWYNTEANEGKVVWEAPQNARWYFGNTRALYKMYFTSAMRDQSETAEQSPCVQFAKEFLPVVDKALSVVYGGEATSTGEKKPVAETAAEPTAKETEPADSAVKAAPDTSEKPSENPDAAPVATPGTAPAETAAPAATEPTTKAGEASATK
jgi:cell division septation protein DedD